MADTPPQECYICNTKTSSWPHILLKSGFFSKKPMFTCEPCYAILVFVLRGDGEAGRVGSAGRSYGKLIKNHNLLAGVKLEDGGGGPKAGAKMDNKLQGWEGYTWFYDYTLRKEEIENYKDDIIKLSKLLILDKKEEQKAYEQRQVKKQKLRELKFEKEQKRQELLKKEIIKLLKKHQQKMPASDIDAHLKHQNVDEIKDFSEEMYHDGKISRTANYRYFILSEEKKKPKKAAEKKADPTTQIRKYAKLRDDGLITEEEYQAKKKEILGL